VEEVGVRVRVVMEEGQVEVGRVERGEMEG
jgi:hypothetical protein